MTASVICDEEEGIFKAWYMVGFYAPGKEHVQCLAISEDGIHWERPNLGRHEALGSKENNITGFIFQRNIHFNLVLTAPSPCDIMKVAKTPPFRRDGDLRRKRLSFTLKESYPDVN
jgi:hypothetical protein